MNNNYAWLAELGIKTILDIGANEGQFAEKISAILPEASLICFEPLPEPFEKLKNKFAGKPGFSCLEIALGEREGRQKIFRNEYSPSSSILTMKSTHKEAFEFARKEFSEEISIRRLDSVAKQIKIEAPYLVKIDVQGYERQVIDGGIDIIRSASIIIIETSFVELYEKSPLFGNIYDKMTSLGFRYTGSFEQLPRPSDGKILQQDAIFQKL